MLEAFAQLQAMARADFAGMSAAKLSLLARLAGRLGLGPIDRAGITPQPGPPEPNPFDEFGDPGAKFFDRNVRK